MRRSRVRLLLASVALIAGAIAPASALARPSAPTARERTVATADPLRVLRSTANELGMGDPDLPPVGREVDPSTYLRLRARQNALYRGAPFTLPYNGRVVAVRQLDRQVAGRAKTGPVWTALGPAPIPNGQTSPSNPVSGRVTAIAVDPGDPADVYVGTAQGGVYRSTDGGSTWTPMMDGAATLAIGSLAFAPSNPSVLYVGTGEGNEGSDNYAGVGLYRIDGANGATPILHGPFETRVAGTGTGAGNGHAFAFEAIQGIAVDPANADVVWFAVQPGGLGVGNLWMCCPDPGPNAEVGIYRTTNGTAATPEFTKVGGGLPQVNPGTFDPAGTDVRFLPGSSTTLLVGIQDVDFATTNNNGVWRTTTADQTTPAFTHIALPNSVYNTRFAASGAAPNSTVLVAAERTNEVGTLFKSTDGGATFPTTLNSAQGFCGQQCWYDMAPAIDPTDTSKMLLGGQADSGGANILMRATNGSNFSSSDAGLHADSHATTYAPSNTQIVYAGNDGGIFKSTDGGAHWSSLNTNGFSATQFVSIAVHPTDPNFTIGGTQDNGTEFLRPNGTWTRADFGDGGFAAIDQNATDTTNVTMYHTYFNETGNIIGYARVTSTANATDNGWSFFGCNGGASHNGIDCGESTEFYAPLTLGPGSPNTVYLGSDRLHRSADEGSHHSTVSQTFIGNKISAIGISPQDDGVRIVGLNHGGVFGTTTGSNTLANLDPANAIPDEYVARTVVDPNDANVAYVTIDGYTGGTGASQSHVWRTGNLGGSPPTWTARNAGLPDVPVNAMAVDPNDSSHLFVGTDIGVYESTDTGAHWGPFGTGLPVVAIYDMAIAQPRTANEVLRVATHGRGMYDAAVGTVPGDTTDPTAAMTGPAKTLQFAKRVALSWSGDDAGGSGVKDFTVEVRQAPAAGTFGPFAPVAGLTDTAATSGAFAGQPGFTYCFRVTARDNALNTSTPSADACTELPVDDRGMTPNGTWTKRAVASAYAKTLSTSTQHGAALKLAGVHARRVGIVYRTCAGCGQLSVKFGSTVLGHVSFAPTADCPATARCFTLFPAFATTRTGAVTFTVSSTGQKVQVDGLIANLNASPTTLRG